MILEIKTFPDEILRKKATDVDKIDDKIVKLLKDMAETLYAAPGYGLAAPQVGVSKRIVVIDETAGKEPGNLLELINPVIFEKTGEMLEEEGCLSIPGEYAFVKRCSNVIVTAHDRDGKEITINASDKLARILQHEIDHLNGALFIDKLSMLKKDSIKKRLKRRIKEGDYRVTGES